MITEHGCNVVVIKLVVNYNTVSRVIRSPMVMILDWHMAKGAHTRVAISMPEWRNENYSHDIAGMHQNGEND